jgi:Fe-S-cluster containining protein
LTSETPPLSVLESCDGCGACCFEQGAPPDYVALRLNPHFIHDPSFAEDAARLTALPAEAAQSLDDYLLAVDTDGTPRNGVCVWFDHDTRRCRHYDFRPSTCRVFELNGAGCHIYRRRQGIPTPCSNSEHISQQCDPVPAFQGEASSVTG